MSLYLSVSTHGPHGVGCPIIQLVPQVPGRDLHGPRHPFVHDVLCLRGVPHPPRPRLLDLGPHSAPEPRVQTGAGVTTPPLVTSDINTLLTVLVLVIDNLLVEAHLGAEVLGADHLVLLLPVAGPGPQQTLRQTEPGLRAGRVRPVTWHY